MYNVDIVFYFAPLRINYINQQLLFTLVIVQFLYHLITDEHFLFFIWNNGKVKYLLEKNPNVELKNNSQYWNLWKILVRLDFKHK